MTSVLQKYGTDYESEIDYCVYDHADTKEVTLYVEIPVGKLYYEKDKKEAIFELRKHVKTITKTHLNNAVQSLNYDGVFLTKSDINDIIKDLIKRIKDDKDKHSRWEAS